MKLITSCKRENSFPIKVPNAPDLMRLHFFYLKLHMLLSLFIYRGSSKCVIDIINNTYLNWEIIIEAISLSTLVNTTTMLPNFLLSLCNIPPPQFLAHSSPHVGTDVISITTDWCAYSEFINIESDSMCFFWGEGVKRSWVFSLTKTKNLSMFLSVSIVYCFLLLSSILLNA
jgi:hypothetical protein